MSAPVHLCALEEITLFILSSNGFCWMNLNVKMVAGITKPVRERNSWLIFFLHLVWHCGEIVPTFSPPKCVPVFDTNYINRCRLYIFFPSVLSEAIWPQMQSLLITFGIDIVFLLAIWFSLNWNIFLYILRFSHMFCHHWSQKIQKSIERRIERKKPYKTLFSKDPTYIKPSLLWMNIRQLLTLKSFFNQQFNNKMKELWAQN